MSEVRIGSGSPRAIIALWLTPEDADALALRLDVRDTGADELHNAAREARSLLGEPDDAL